MENKYAKTIAIDVMKISAADETLKRIDGLSKKQGGGGGGVVYLARHGSTIYNDLEKEEDNDDDGGDCHTGV
jgi:hypothetical protein